MKITVKPKSSRKPSAGAVKKKKPQADLDLTNIYKKNKKEEFAKLEGKPQSESMRKVMFGVLCLLILATAGFFFVKPETKPVANVEMHVIPPSLTEIKSGRLLTLPFTVSNELGITVYDVAVELTVPVGWYTESTSPESETVRNPIWRLDVMEPGEEHVFEVTGRMFQPVGWSGTWKLEGEYEPENFSSVFSFDAEWNAFVSDSAFDLELTKDTAYRIAFASDEEGLTIPDGLELRADWPSTLPKPHYDPKPVDESDPVWAIPVENTEYEISITPSGGGSFDDESSPSIGASLWWKGGTQAIEIMSVSEGVTEETVVKSIGLYSSVNGSANTKTANWGETLNWEIIVENPTEVALSDNRVRLFIRSDIVKEVRLRTGDTVTPLELNPTKGYVTLNKDILPALEILPSGKKIAIKTDIVPYAFTDIAGSDMSEGHSISIHAELTAQLPVEESEEEMVDEEEESEEKTKETTVATQPHRITMNGFWLADSMLRYYTDQQLPIGTGPVPFEPKRETVLMLKHEITNVNHTLREIEIIHELPEYVSFITSGTGNVGAWTTDPDTRTLTWKLNQIPASESVSGRTVYAVAMIAVTPKEASENPIVIIPESVMKATDAKTGGVTEKSLPALTTDMNADPFAKYDGSVSDAEEAIE